MTNDAERREAAARLRELRLDPWDDAACEIAQCAGIACCNSECHGSNETPECTMALASRLADLIEPSKPKVKCVAEVKVDGERLERLAHDAAVELTGIDRDALLELAEDVDEAAAMAVVMDASKGAKLLADLLLDIARRIREALGVTDG